MAVYSVSQVVGYLRQVLEQDSLLQDTWIRGEVANLAQPGSGHSYFSLRDSRTTLRCAMFRGAFGAELLSDGGAILAHGRVSVYQARGDLQLIVDILQPEGVGELQLKFEQLKLKLQAEGLFEPSRKRPLPEFPSRLGVATSPTGAVWHDIQTVVGRRYPLVELLLAPTSVQGAGAVEAIVEALEALDHVPDLDAVILARGGGSLEDLWPFNEEAVARSVFASRAPVISAVGHETDYTIVDMVADQRAPTPSAGAEMAVPDRMDLASGLLASQQSLTASISGHVRSGWQSLLRSQPRLRRGRPDLDTLRLRIDDLLGSAARHLRRGISARSERSDNLRMRLESLSPKDILRRGYAIVQAAGDSAVISEMAQVAAGDRVDVTLAKGGFAAEVRSTRDSDGASETRGAETASPLPI